MIESSANSVIRRGNLLCLLLLLVAPFSGAGQYNQVISIGDSMPAFSSLPNTNGGTLSSSDIEEDVVVLISMANHCPWSRGTERDLIKLADAYRGKSVRFIGFSVNNDEADRLPAMKERAKKIGYNFDYIRDDSQEFGRFLGATRTPEYYVFNRERKLVYTGLLHNSPASLSSYSGEPAYTRGEPKDHYVADAIDLTLAGKAVEVAETRAHGCTVVYDNS